MSEQNSTGCCPRFDPAPWDQKEHTWNNRKFVQDRVKSFFHIPLNFGAVMMRNMPKIESAGALPANVCVLSDENSLWGADVFIEVTKDIPDSKMTTISGTFLSKVYEGPYKNMGSWIKDMHKYVKETGRPVEKFYFFYTTCPKCAKAYGKNYVVILAKVA